MPRAHAFNGGLRETLVASAARTATGDSGPLTGWYHPKTLRAQLRTTAASGTTPTLNVVIEDSLDDGATWNVVGTFAQQTAAAREVINITTPFSDTLRVRWTIGGTATPTFTFAVDVYSED
jgi:hypothetical protein